MNMTKEEAEVLVNQAIDNLSAEVLQEDMSNTEVNAQGVHLARRIVELLEFISS
jgi:hypothetical protein